MTKIKICGLFRPVDIEYVNEALPDYIGFVFAKSKRQVTSVQAEKMKRNLDQRIKSVGVFVNEPLENVISLLNKGIIDIAQLHGDEDESYIERLKAESRSTMIKAIRVETAVDVLEAQKVPSDYLLLDHGKGGTGEAFDWSFVRECSKPFFLAGGIRADNVEDAVKRLNPFAVDLSSGVETAGVKDKDKILDIVRRVRNV